MAQEKVEEANEALRVSTERGGGGRGEESELDTCLAPAHRPITPSQTPQNMRRPSSHAFTHLSHASHLPGGAGAHQSPSPAPGGAHCGAGQAGRHVRERQREEQLGLGGHASVGAEAGGAQKTVVPVPFRTLFLSSHLLRHTGLFSRLALSRSTLPPVDAAHVQFGGARGRPASDPLFAGCGFVREGTSGIPTATRACGRCCCRSARAV